MSEGTAVHVSEVQEVLGRWWWKYDEGHFDVLASLLTDDVHFVCRTDTGTTDFEEFVRADVRGRDAVMEWETRHRTDSPYPLRHHGTNVHVTARRAGEADFASYIHVTHNTTAGVTNLSSAIVNGSVRRAGDSVLIAALEVVLDTRESVLFSQR